MQKIKTFVCICFELFRNLNKSVYLLIGGNSSYIVLDTMVFPGLFVPYSFLPFPSYVPIIIISGKFLRNYESRKQCVTTTDFIV